LSTPPLQPSGGLSGRRLKAVLDFIEENLQRRMTLRHLAERSGVSIRHFERAFRQSIGVPPHRYVLERRIAAAQNLLRRTHLTIDEIAAQAGFDSSSHLALTFRRRFGCSPAAFRRLQRD
jgi:AraC family transcriptional regulator